MSDETISVVIPYYNRENTIEQTLESVYKQSYPVTEVIVVNDGSQESSRSFLGDIIKQYSNLKVIDQTNSGASVARNQGILASTSDFIAFIDSDDCWNPMHIEESIKLFRSNGTIIATHSRFHYMFDGCNNNLSLVARLETRLRPWRDYGRQFEDNHYVIRSDAAVELLVTTKAGFSTSSVVIAKNRMDAVPLFDPLLVFGEDVDFFTAAVLSGDVGYIDTDQSFYRIHDTNTIDTTLDGDILDLDMRIRMLRSLEKRLMYSVDPTAKAALLGVLSQRYYWLAQSLSTTESFREALKWYWLSYNLKPNMASLKHIVINLLLPDCFVKKLY